MTTVRVLSDGLSPTSLADVPRATSPVLGPPESSRSRALVVLTQGSRYGNHHATSHGTSRRIGTTTWDIAANRHHYEQSKLCHMQLSQNDWLNVIRSCVSIQQNCQEARQELCRNFCAVDRSRDRLSCGKLSNRNHKWGPQRDAILLTHRQVFPFNIIIMYMRTKCTRLLSIMSQYSFPWCKNYGPRGGVYQANFLRSVIFPFFSEWSKQWLPVWYEAHIWQVSPPLSCGDTWQIWTWLKLSDLYFC